MRVLILGSGGREHAIAWKIAQSKKIKKIYCFPGNAGIKKIAQIPNLDVENNIQIIEFVKNNNIDLTIVGPEALLVNGIVDELEDAGYKAFGPRMSSARFESSKIFTKEFLIKNNIPTGKYKKFSNSDDAQNFLISNYTYPIVIKVDGLAAGKGVIICNSMNEAQLAINDIMVNNKFGHSGSKIIIEEFLDGHEISILTFVDGKTMKVMELAKDYKKIGNGDIGLNTGGMGCISPNPNVTNKMKSVCEEKILKPVMTGIINEKIDFRGVLFIGIIYTELGPKVLEFNVRFGDPETQVILPRLKNDLIDVFLATINKNLNNIDLHWKNNHVCSIVLSSNGYPEKYQKGIEIKGLENEDSLIFHAGTKQVNEKIVTNGGRVLNITSSANSSENAIKNAYGKLKSIYFDGMYYRQDIGK